MALTQARPILEGFFAQPQRDNFSEWRWQKSQMLLLNYGGQMSGPTLLSEIRQIYYFLKLGGEHFAENPHKAAKIPIKLRQRIRRHSVARQRVFNPLGLFASAEVYLWA
ncbi:MAG: hypothetical protein LBR11_01690 [Deltaproteobacteria bacterium]|nr:hypothetical protein [Deltaproteobacteria bacterium]